MTYIIGEIGINHNGDIQNAKKLILLAKNLGFDAVKFQKRTPEISTPKTEIEKLRETPWGLIKYIDYKKKLELSRKDYDEINIFCKKLRFTWFASAWDIKSLIFLDKYKLKYQKIASAMLTNYKLIKEISKRKTYTFISTGGATFKEIQKVIHIFKKDNCPFELMHSVSIYPCENHMLNLEMLKILKKKFKCPVGYSGHESTVMPSILAVALGASSIERHITLDRTMWGSDQAASLGPEGMKMLVQDIRKIKLILGDGIKRNIELEKKKISTMIYW
jgi:N-acetylneuraminate synthase